jgi:hypothetical protein
MSFEPIDEASRRRPEFAGGVPITLPDGQSWYFYEPGGRARYPGYLWRFGDDVAPEIEEELSRSFDLSIDPLCTELPEQDHADACVDSAYILLTRNYDVNPDEFRESLMNPSHWLDQDATETLLGQFKSLIQGACLRKSALMTTYIVAGIVPARDHRNN